MLDSLKVSDLNAQAILALGIQFDVFDDDIPESPKDRMEEAHKLVAFGIEGLQNEGSDDEEVVEQINSILAAAGVEVDGDNAELVTFGEIPDAEALTELLEENEVEFELEEGEEEEGEESEEEAAFEVDDIIEDWSTLKLKDAKAALQEWWDEDEEAQEIEFEEISALLEYENEQDNPRKSIVSMLEEFADSFEGEPEDEGEAEGEEPEEGEEGEAEAEESDGEFDEEPYEGYDDAKVGDLKEVIDDEERTVEELEYIAGYEEAHKNRSTILKRVEARIEELNEPEGEEEPEEEPEEKPAKRGKKAKKAEPAEEVDEDELEENLPPHFAELISEDHATEQAEALGLKPADDEYEAEELPPMPEDIAAEDRDTLSALMGQYTAAHTTAAWHGSREYVLSSGYEEVSDYYENSAFLEAEGNEAMKKAESKTDGRVVYFRAKQKTHYNQYVVLRDVKDTLKRRIETISRVGGFKVDSDEGESQITPAKPKARRTRSRSK